VSRPVEHTGRLRPRPHLQDVGGSRSVGGIPTDGGCSSGSRSSAAGRSGWARAGFPSAFCG
jgi:hypothetical protein